VPDASARTNASLTIARGGAPGPSPAVNSRPRRTGVPVVRK
jgi:hypothetical protein